MTSTIDLHIHSTASDGTLSPSDIVEEALLKGLKYISITDHESIAGYSILNKIKPTWKNKLKIIPGLELHTYYKGYEIHLLGYCIDLKNIYLIKRLKELRQARTEVSYRTVQYLNKAGIKLQWKDIENITNGDVAITKAHIIAALKKSKNISRETFYTYFHPRGKLYLPFTDHNLEDAINLIKHAGGIPVLAHPGLIGNDNLVNEILNNFEIGLEVYYHYFGEKAVIWVEKFKKFADIHNVIMTGGTDYHGNITPVEIGDTYVPPQIIDQLTFNKNSFFNIL
ncbi:MAG: 3,5-nucleoside bisphosphate phosphatase [Clostridia bacterium]|jgi:hypothetical protein|nr:3,5-nucleoside bisphosphate phosphatase [Clostridia bacterium]MDN5323378.1 3,5-nucleoside bisphosphate phosphatase [Clostridia bacterium]